MADTPSIPPALTANEQERQYRADVDLELATLRVLLLSAVGVLAAEKNDVDKANGIVRRVGIAAKEALESFHVDNEVYKEDEFKVLASSRIASLLDGLRFSSAEKK